jgi:hypothetical protein
MSSFVRFWDCYQFSLMLYIWSFLFLFLPPILLVVILNFMQKEKYIHFTNLVLHNPFKYFLVIGDYLFYLIVTHPCILLIVCFCTSMSCIKFSSSSSSFCLQIKFLMQRHFMLSNYETTIKFILLIAFSFNLNGYLSCCRTTKFYHLGC